MAPLVAVLDRLALPTLIQGLIPGQGPAQPSTGRIVRPGIHVTTTGNRNALLAGCDIVVCQAADIAVPGLLAGKPLLMLPVFVEQMMTLHRVATQGMGHGLSPDSDEEAIDAALRRLVDDREARARAADFSRLYDGYRPGIAVDAVAGEVDELVG